MLINIPTLGIKFNTPVSIPITIAKGVLKIDKIIVVTIPTNEEVSKMPLIYELNISSILTKYLINPLWLTNIFVLVNVSNFLKSLKCKMIIKVSKLN